ncbi:MAG: aminopeptidase, partial [Agathobacter sp.]|nr:aminopeptidase [Agathobacter sp.]
MERKNAWLKYPQGEKRDEVFAFAEDYRKFISICKTERECATYIYDLAKAAGFEDLDEAIAAGKILKAGDKVMANNMGKGLAMFILGEKNLEEGMNILGAHIDSPRIDLKQVPMFEDTDMAMLDTHYYGGIKKYQWVALPLALHGVICKKDGSIVNVNIGDKADDPVFGISDLLIHLAGDQLGKTASKVIEGESLDVLIGSIPMAEEDAEEVKEKVKGNILRILEETYGVEEEDFLSAEIEVVPAGDARDYGFDRSMIMGYGHDDRVCAWPSYKAMLEIDVPEYTSVC